jgi:sphingolipid delta-4 desaturase
MAPQKKEVNYSENEDSLLLSLPKTPIVEPATQNTNFIKDYNYFHVMKHDEPHTVRRKRILESHPELEKLFKKEPYITLFCALWLHLIQIFICSLIAKFQFSFFTIFLLALMLGAIFSHGLFVLYHDITHFNCFKSVKLNQLAAIFANLTQIIPSAIGFGRYHRDHHSFLGDPILDPDIPTVWEIKFFKTSFRRFCYIIFLPFFYAFRPYFKTPKSVSYMEILNAIACISFGYWIQYYFCGKALGYLIMCTYFGISCHPVAAHVIAEHYEFFKGQDTYSYYGWINYLNFNMGYHVEHHDFPNIAWYKLPQVRKIAPEFYNTLPVMDSYVMVIFKYIFDGSIGPWSRISIEDSYKHLKQE